MSQIVQFGLSRTGSTLIYRVLKHISRKTIKCHLPEIPDFLNADADIIASIRHPIDSFISHVRVSEYPDSDPGPIRAQMIMRYLPKRLAEHRSFKEIINEHPILVLKYETFFNNFDYIFDSIEPYFGITIDRQHREDIVKNCSLEQSLEIQNKYSGFSDYDEESQIHGNHIYSPVPEDNRKLITPSLEQELTERFKEYIDDWEQYA